MHPRLPRLWLLAACALSVGCFVQKNPLQDVDSGNVQVVLATGGLTGTIIVQGAATQVDGGIAPGTFRDVTIIATFTTVIDNQERVQSYTTSPDDSGRWSMNGLPAGTYAIQAEKPGYGTRSTSATVTGNIINVVSELTLNATGVQVTGCAELVAPGAGSGGVKATLLIGPEGQTQAQPPISLTLATCPDGQPGYPITFTSVPSGSYLLQVTSPGFTGETPPFTVSDSDVTLQTLLVGRATGSVTGTITDMTDSAVSGLDLSGINVILTDTDTMQTVAETTTDMSGAYTFQDVPASTTGTPYAVSIASDVFVVSGMQSGASLGTVLVQPGANPAVGPAIDVKIGLWNITGCLYVPPPAMDSSGAILTLTGTESADHQPITLPMPTGMPITTAAGPNCVPGNAAGVEGIGSTFQIPAVPAGSYSLTIVRGGYQTVTLAVTVPTPGPMGPTDTAVPTVNMSRALFSFTGNVCASESSSNLLSTYGDSIEPTPLSATVTLTGGSLGSTVYGPASTPSLSTQGANNMCGNNKTLNYTFTNIPEPLGPSDQYLLTISKPGYTNSPSTLRCQGDPSNDGFCSSSSTIRPSAGLQIHLVDNTITGCILPDSPGPAASGITVQLGTASNPGIAFDGYPVPPPQTPPVPAPTVQIDPTAAPPDCSGLGFSGIQGYSFSFAGVPDGQYAVIVTSNGYESVTVQNIYLTQTQDQNLVLPAIQLKRQLGTIVGQVQAVSNAPGISTAPIDSQNATVQLIGADTVGNIPQILTDTIGSYEFDNVPVSPAANTAYTVRASKLGFTSSGDQGVVVLAHETPPVPMITLTLDQNTVSGCVIAPPSGPNPVSPTATLAGQVTVIAGNPAYNPAPVTATASASCGANGYLYSFPGVPYGSYTITLAAAGYNTLTVPGVFVAGQDVTLPAHSLSRTTVSVTGMVSFQTNGTAIVPNMAGALVKLTGTELLNTPLQTYTDATGAFTFGAVPVSPSGTAYTITVSDSGYTAVPSSGTVTVAAPGPVTAPALGLSVTASTVSGCVTVPDPDATGPVNVALSGTSFDGSPLPTGMPLAAAAGGSCPAHSYTYSFPSIPNGTYQLAFSTTGFDSFTVSHVIVVGADVQVPPSQFNRSRGGVTGSVQVSDPSGTGITPKLTGVTVSLTGSDALGLTLQTPITSSMGNSGTYNFINVPANSGSNRYTVTAAAPGYVAKSAGTNAAQVPQVQPQQTATAPTLLLAVAASSVNGCVILPPPAQSSAGVNVTLAGTAFDGTSISLPVPAMPATPILSSGGCANGPANASAFTIPNVPNGTYTITLSHAGYEPVTYQNVAVASANVTLPLTQMNASLGSISGTVVASAGSTSLPVSTTGAMVTLSGPTANGATYQSQIALSGSSYNFTNVPVSAVGGTYTITVTNPGYVADVSPTVTVQAGQTANAAKVTLSPSVATVQGCVLVPAPAPDSSGVTVTMTGTPQIAPANMLSFPPAGQPAVLTSTSAACSSGQPLGGSFAFTGVPSGAYTVEFTLAGFAPITTSIVVSGNSVTVPTVTLGRQVGTVTGTVTLNNNNTPLNVDPAGNVLVTLSSSTGDLLSTPFQTLSNGMGAYIFTGVPVSPTNAPYTLSFTKANYSAPATPVTVVVQPNANNAASTQITMTINANTISGCVYVPPPGAGSGGVTIKLSGTAFDGTMIGPVSPNSVTPGSSSTCTDAYTYTNMPNGIYQILVTASGFGNVTLSGLDLAYTSSGNTLQAPLASMPRLTATVTGTVVAADNKTGLPVNSMSLNPANALVTITGNDLAGQILQASTDAGGHFTFPSVPYNSSGNTYTVNVSKSGYASVSTLLMQSISSSTVLSGTFAAGSFQIVPNANTVSGCVANPPGVTMAPTVTATLSGTAFTGAPYPVAGTQTTNPPTVTATLGACTIGAQPALGYSFSNVPDGSYDVQITATGFVSNVLGTFVVAGGAVTLPTETLTRATTTLFGAIGVQDATPATGISLGTTAPSSDLDGITVTLTGTDTTVVNYTAVTDNYGHWAMSEVPVPVAASSTYMITASKPGYATLAPVATPTIAADSNVQVPLPKLAVDSHAVAGCVQLQGGASPASATALLGGTAFNGTEYPTNAPYTITGTITSTKCGGGATGLVYDFLNVPDGAYTVTLKDTGYASETLPVVVAGADVPSSQNITTLAVVPVTGSLSGKIAASASGTAFDLTQVDAAGVVVSVYDPSSPSTLLAAAVTDAGGNWSIPSLTLSTGTATTFTVTASKSGYTTLSTSAAVSPNQNTVVTFSSSLNVIGSTVAFCAQLSPSSPSSSSVTAVINGVAFNGTSFPWSGAVTLPKASAGGSACGAGMSSATSFQFPSNIPNGTYTLTLSLAGYTSVTTQPFTVNAVDTATTVTVSTTQTVLPQGTGTISGTVVAQDSGTGLTIGGGALGVSAQPAQIAISGTGLGSIAPANISAAGTFQFSNVPISPTGSPYTLSLVTASAPNFTMVGSYSVVVQPSATVTAGPIVLRLTTGSVSGVVKLPAPASDSADVSAYLSGTAFTGGAWTGGAIAPSDANGNITFSNVPPGTYTLTLNRSGYSTATVSNLVVTAGANTVFTTVTMSPITSMFPATVSGCVFVPAPGTPTAGVTVTLNGTTFAGSMTSTTAKVLSTSPQPCDGGQPGLAYAFPNVAGGNYQVQFTGNGFITYTVPNVTVAPTTSGTTVTVPLVVLSRALSSMGGNITASANGTGLIPDVTGAVVSLTGTDLEGGTYQSTVTPNSSPASSATYNVTGIPVSPNSNPYYVVVTKPGYEQLNPSSAFATPPGPVPLQIEIAVGQVSGCVYVPPPATDSTGVSVSLTGLAFNGATYTATPIVTNSMSTTCPLGLQYSFSNVPTGTYNLALTRTGFGTATVHGVTVIANATTSVPTQMLAQAYGSLSGQISITDTSMTGLNVAAVDLSGFPILVSGGGLSTSVGTVTDASGHWSILQVPVPIDSSTFTVTASKFGYDSTPVTGVTLSAGSNTPVSGPVLNVKAYTLTGTVNVSTGFHAADNSNVTAKLAGTAFNGTSYGPVTATSTNTGGISFSNVPAGTYSVTLSKTLYTTVTIPGVTVPSSGFGTVSMGLTDSTSTPTTPIISLTNSSPTSSTSTTINLVQPSTDPGGSLYDYVVTLCKGSGSSNCTVLAGPPDSGTVWNGTPTTFGVSGLGVGVDNYITVTGRNYAGVQSAPATAVLHVETTAPNQPQNVYVDNRPGSAVISWQAPSASSSSLPVAGYYLFYGPLYERSESATVASSGITADGYTGTGAAEGPSPIYVGNVTQFALTGLPNGQPFYVAVAAADSVVDPGPNLSTLTMGRRALPNPYPFDRAVHQNVLSGASSGNAMVVLPGDYVVVSTTTMGQSSLQAYQYNQHSNFPTVGSPAVAPAHAAILVNDGASSIIYGLDATASTPGVDVFTFDPMTATLSANTTLTSSGAVDHLIPTHRYFFPNNTMGQPSAHGVFTYNQAGTFKISSYHVDNFNHQTLTEDADATNLADQSRPNDLKTAGDYAFVLHNGDLNGYTLHPTAPGMPPPPPYSTPITDDSSTCGVSVPGDLASATIPDRQMIVDWPNIYFTCGSANSAVCMTAVTTPSGTLTCGSPSQIIQTEAPITKLIQSGDLLLIGEEMGAGVTAMEAFNVGTPTAAFRVGTYDLNANATDTGGVSGQPYIGASATVADFQMLGSNLFMLLTNAPGQTPAEAYVDVVETGGVRAVSDVSSFTPNSSGRNWTVLDAVARGSRVISYVGNFPSGMGGTTFVSSVSLAQELSASTDFVISSGEPTNSGSPYDTTVCQNGPCLPMVVYGDYAFAAIHTSTGSYQVQMFDVSMPDSAPSLVTKFDASHPITGLTVANDYLYATEDNQTQFLERFDLDPTSTSWSFNGSDQGYTPTVPTGSGMTLMPSGSHSWAPPQHRAYDVVAAGPSQVYVAADNGVCTVTSNTSLGSFVIKSCANPGFGSTALSIDASNIYVGEGGRDIGVYNLASLNSNSPTLGPDPAGQTQTQTLEQQYPSTDALSIQAMGPNVFASFFDTTTMGLAGLNGFDPTIIGTASSPVIDTVLGGDSSLLQVANGKFAVTGPYIIVPDEVRGLVLMHAY